MAQAQKKTFTIDQTQEHAPQGVAPEPLANTPLAFWSGMAEMQRRFFDSLVATTERRINAGATVTELRPSELAPIAASPNWIAAMTECQQELASFVQERLTKNQAFMASAAAAPGLQEFLNLQAGWMSETAQDYSHEIERLAGILKNGADEIMATTA